ncbi:MAG: metallophosphoesterase family protein [Nitrospirota bacterium]
MKVGIISDTHVPGAAAALPGKVFELFTGVDLILHAGDIVSLSVLDELSVIAPVEAVAGNMDGAELRLPAKKVLTLGKFTVGLIHGKYRIDVQKEMIRKDFGAVDLIVYGHSHMPFWGRVGDVLFLNPGSPTDTRHAPYNSVALLTVGDTLSAEIVRL